MAGSKGQAEFTDEEVREFTDMALERERNLKLGFTLAGVAKNHRHDMWLKWNASKQSQTPDGSESMNSDDFPESSQASSCASSAGPPVKFAYIHHPTNGETTVVDVIQDSGSRVSLIHPNVVQSCDLIRKQTARISLQTVTGQVYECDEWVEVTWIGKPGRSGRHMFYVAPDESPINLLVGRQFLEGNEGVFMDTHPVEPTLVNVLMKETRKEKAQIENNKTAADTQSAMLQEQMAQRKKQKLKDKQLASSSQGLSYSQGTGG